MRKVKHKYAYSIANEDENLIQKRFSGKIKTCLSRPHREKSNNNQSTTYQGMKHKANQKPKLKLKGKIWLWHREVQQQQQPKR
jgi:hypothetical protein